MFWRVHYAHRSNENVMIPSLSSLESTFWFIQTMKMLKTVISKNKKTVLVYSACSIAWPGTTMCEIKKIFIAEFGQKYHQSKERNIFKSNCMRTSWINSIIIGASSGRSQSARFKQEVTEMHRIMEVKVKSSIPNHCFS